MRTTGPDEQVPSLINIGGGISAWDCYWDGVLISSSGTPGNSRQTEIGGMSSARVELSPEMAEAGQHVVAIRLSTFRSARAGARFAQLSFYTLPLEKFRALDMKLNLLPAMGVGAMLTIGVAVFLMWLLADRRLILALLAALCLGSALLITVVTVPIMWAYPVSWMPFQIVARISLIVIVSSLLLAAAVVHLYPSWWRSLLVVPLIVQTAIASYCLPLGINVLSPVLWRVAFISALLFVGWAVWRRREGSRLILVGIVATCGLFEWDPKHFEHSNFVFAFLPTLVGLISAIGLRLRSERLHARDTKLMAARLEIELLKKSLQPHFLMNTLTALSQVIEEKPAAAVRLIDDLAVGFRSLARFSGEKQVSIGEELALCRAHLGVMSARTDLNWSLEAEGIDASASVPPALFLTLIENGFSHQRPRKDATTFTLRAERTSDGVRYIFLSPGTITEDTARVSGGTGLRYVCARLEESFHDAWKLTQGAVAGGWETVIELREAARSGART
ncbi:MAG TPA: histidine kinase [Opitutaceae bacterium]|nr:histidine kinase [Opitutaceae bacterium]